MISLIRRLFEKPAKAEERRPRLQLPHADFSAIYAIGDVHGCLKLLKAAYGRILDDAATIPGKKLVVFLGDYVDRGPDSKAVLDFLTALDAADVEHVCLCGNHDAEFMAFLDSPRSNMGWLGFGGTATLRSYGIDVDHALKSGGLSTLENLVRRAVPASHTGFLSALPSMLQVGTLVFVHAGLRPGIALEEQTDQDLLWIREPFLSVGPKLPILVVHGHTIHPEPHFGNHRVGIDTGAFATGRLTALKISGETLDIL